MKMALLLSISLAGGNALAQVSVPLAITTSQNRLDRGSPYFLNDSTVVFADAGKVFGLSTVAGSKAVPIANIGTYVAAIAQAPDGKVYAVPGGVDCDVLSPTDRLLRVTGTSARTLGAETVMELAPDSLGYVAGVIAFSVSAGGVAWIANERRVATVDLETGRVSAFSYDIEAPAPAQSIWAIDPTTAVSRRGLDNPYVFTISGSTLTTRVLPSARTIWDVRVVSGEIYAVTSEHLLRFDKRGNPVGQARALPVSSFAWSRFAGDDLVLLQTGSRLTRWTPSTGDTTSMPYYPEVDGWGILAATTSSSGAIALHADDQLYAGFIPEYPIPLAQQFVQIIPAGADPTLMGPPLSVTIDFKNASQPFDNRKGPRYTITAKNESGQLVEEALVAGVYLFGVPCAEFFNGGNVKNLPSGSTAEAVAANAFYYVPPGSMPPPGTRIQDYFKIMHSNGRPVASGTGVGVDYLVTSIRDIAQAPDVKLFPSLASTSITVQYTDPRQKLLILDALGRVAFRQNLDLTQTRVTVDVSSFGESLHYLLLTSQTGTSVHPFTVQH